MKKSDAFPSNFLKATDADGGDLVLTIKSVDQEEVGNDTKVLITFRESPKKLVLNKTNWGLIEELHGEDTDDWYGKRITLYKTKVDFKGDRVDSLRVRLTDAGSKNGAPAPGQKAEDGLIFTDPTLVYNWCMKASRPGIEVKPEELMQVEDAAAALGFGAELFDKVEAFQTENDLTTKLGLIKDAMKAVIAARNAAKVAAGDIHF